MRTPNVNRIADIKAFSPTPGNHTEVLIRVLELALHNRKQTLQQGLINAALEFLKKAWDSTKAFLICKTD